MDLMCRDRTRQPVEPDQPVQPVTGANPVARGRSRARKSSGAPGTHPPPARSAATSTALVAYVPPNRDLEVISAVVRHHTVTGTPLAGLFFLYTTHLDSQGGDLYGAMVSGVIARFVEDDQNSAVFAIAERLVEEVRSRAVAEGRHGDDLGDYQENCTKPDGKLEVLFLCNFLVSMVCQGHDRIIYMLVSRGLVGRAQLLRHNLRAFRIMPVGCADDIALRKMMLHVCYVSRAQGAIDEHTMRVALWRLVNSYAPVSASTDNGNNDGDDPVEVIVNLAHIVTRLMMFGEESASHSNALETLYGRARYDDWANDCSIEFRHGPLHHPVSDTIGLFVSSSLLTAPATKHQYVLVFRALRKWAGIYGVKKMLSLRAEATRVAIAHGRQAAFAYMMLGTGPEIPNNFDNDDDEEEEEMAEDEDENGDVLPHERWPMFSDYMSQPQVEEVLAAMHTPLHMRREASRDRSNVADDATDEPSFNL